jgi:hypothetical protein
MIDSFLLEKFPSEEKYFEILEKSKEYNILLWNDDSKKILIINSNGYNMIKNLIE